jgi:hypothetical protein
MVVLVIVAAAILGPAIAAAAAELLHLLVIVLVALAAVAGVGLIAYGAWRLRQARPATARVVHPVTPAPWQAVQARTEPRRAIEWGGQLHLHFHGVDAEDVAAIIRRQQEDQ